MGRNRSSSGSGADRRYMQMKPGEYLLDESAGPIQANVGRRTVRLRVKNTGDRPVQVGSHYHFFEVNKALSFDREKKLRDAAERCRRHRRALRAWRGKGD